MASDNDKPEEARITKIYKFSIYQDVCQLCEEKVTFTEDKDPFIVKTTSYGYLLCDKCGANLALMVGIEVKDLGDITEIKFRR